MYLWSLLTHEKTNIEHLRLLKLHRLKGKDSVHTQFYITNYYTFLDTSFVGWLY